MSHDFVRGKSVASATGANLMHKAETLTYFFLDLYTQQTQKHLYNGVI